ncbi:MAG: COG4223 family protein [Alphaproteobacteria bacterium]
MTQKKTPPKTGKKEKDVVKDAVPEKKKPPSLTGVEFVDPETDLGVVRRKKPLWLKVIFVCTLLALLFFAAAYMRVLPAALLAHLPLPALEESQPAYNDQVDDALLDSGELIASSIAIPSTTELVAEEESVADIDVAASSAFELPEEVSILPEMMGSIEGRLNRLEVLIGELAEKSFTDELLMISFVQLNQALGQGVPFSSELGTFKTFAAGDAHLRENFIPFLEKNAARGIPTYYQLKQDFGDLAAKSIKKKKSVGASVKGFFGHVKHYFSSLIVVKKRVDVVETAETKSSDALKNASLALRKNNFRAALQMVTVFEGAEKALFQDWIDQTTQRFDADEKLASLQTYLMTRLTVKRKLMTTLTQETNGKK